MILCRKLQNYLLASELDENNRGYLDIWLWIINICIYYFIAVFIEIQEIKNQKSNKVTKFKIYGPYKDLFR